jgi:hypothetical protein
MSAKMSVRQMSVGPMAFRLNVVEPLEKNNFFVCFRKETAKKYLQGMHHPYL